MIHNRVSNISNKFQLTKSKLSYFDGHKKINKNEIKKNIKK
jgi:hypothetical protein